MRLVVDLTLCQGYAQCCFLAPEVFQLAGQEALIYVPEPDDAQRTSVLRSAAACPVGAILVEEPVAIGADGAGRSGGGPPGPDRAGSGSAG